MENVEDIIEKVVGHLPDDSDEYTLLDEWVSFLEENLIFPFEAVFMAFSYTETLKSGDKLKVHQVDNCIMPYGILMKVKLGRKSFVVPLEELTVTDVNSKNFLYVEAYKEWFPTI